MDSRLFWLAMAAFVGAAEGGLISSMLPMISAEMGVTIGQAGLLVVGHGLAYAVGPPLVAILFGGIGRRRILAGAELGIAVCALLMAIAPFFELTVGVRSVLAVCAGTFTGTALATAATLAPPGSRGRSMQIITMGRSLAALLGVPLGALVATQLDWRFNYWALAALGAAAALALYIKLPQGMHGDTQTMRDRIHVLGNPGVALALLTTVLFVVGATGAGIYIAAILTGAGIGLHNLPLVLLASGLGALLSSLSAGRFADRTGNRIAAILASIATMGTLTVLAVLPMLPAELRLPVLIGSLGVSGYAVPAYAIAVGSELAQLAPNSVSVAISLNMSAFSVAAAIAAAAGGAIVDTWGPGVLALAGLGPMLAAVGVWQVPGLRGAYPGLRIERPAGEPL